MIEVKENGPAELSCLANLSEDQKLISLNWGFEYFFLSQVMLELLRDLVDNMNAVLCISVVNLDRAVSENDTDEHAQT